MPSIRLSPAGFLARIPGPAGERSAVAFEHGSLLVKLFAPGRPDTQTPHTRDEVYFVVRGSGTFVHGDRRDAFQANDFLFAPAGLAHRLEEFTPDLLLWVLYYGPEGGERPDRP